MRGAKLGSPKQAHKIVGMLQEKMLGWRGDSLGARDPRGARKKKEMRTLTCCNIAGAFAVAFAALAAAQTPARAASGTADEQRACTPDVFRLCAAEIPNEDRIVQCLNRKVSKLSPACRAVIDGSDEDKHRRKRDG